MPPKIKGVLFTVASAASLSVTFIASKQALQELTPLGFAPMWFLAALLWGLGYYALQPTKITVSTFKPHWKSLLLLGLSSSIANFFFFTNISLGDPTVIAFFSRATTIFALLMGVGWLGESMTRAQWLGAAVAVAGAGVMTYHGGSLIWLVLALALGSSFFHALTSYVAKKSVTQVSPLVLNLARTLILTICLGSASLLTGQLVWPSLTTLLWIGGGSFFGPFLSYLLFYQGMQTLDISKATIIRASQPLFVACYSWVLLGQVISLQQFMGGMVILAGVVLILLPCRGSWGVIFQKRRQAASATTADPALQGAAD